MNIHPHTQVIILVHEQRQENEAGSTVVMDLHHTNLEVIPSNTSPTAQDS